MKGQFLAVTLALTLLPSARAAAPGGWEQIGDYLKQACNVTQGGAGGVFEGSQKLDWMCNIASSYGFFTNNILNGDWEAFGKEVVGKYSSQFVSHLGTQMGFDRLNTITASINDAMKETYADFKGILLGAMTATLREQMNGRQLDDNRGLPVTTPGGMADWAVKVNPYLTVAQTVGRAQNTAEMFAQLTKAAQAKKLAQQSNDAITSAMKPALEGAARVIGTPVAPGFADEQDLRAKTALSTREVQELHLGSFNAYMKQDAAFRVAELQMLSEIAKQGVMTNTQLLAKLEDTQAALAAAENGLKAQVEQEAKQNLDAAASAARQYVQLLNSYKALMDRDRIRDAQSAFVNGL